MSRILPTNVGRRIAALVLAMTALAAFPSAAQDALYLTTETALVDGNGTKLATVAPGMPVDVLAQKGDLVRVAVMGWSPEGGESYLFYAIGQRILVARLTEEGVAAAVSQSQQEDDYENLWFDIRVTGWLPRADTGTDVAEVWQAGSALFHQRCTRCHALHRPVEFSANQWPAILKIMTLRAGLKGPDRALVVQYLQTHAKDGPAKGGSTKDDAGTAPIEGDAALAKAGAAAYDDNGCAGCHGEDAATPADIAYPLLAGQSADYVSKQLKDFKSGARANDSDETMRGALEGLAEADMRAIAWWLSSLGSQQ
jgi:cytochrome c553